MNNINNLLDNLERYNNREIIVNYYHHSTINNITVDNGTGIESENNRIVNPSNSEDSQVNVQIQRGGDENNLAETQINATIDYNSDLSNIENIVSFTDALSSSIAQSLENIEIINSPGLSLSNILNKTELFIYKTIEDPEDKCHICNEQYSELDICRKNKICNHYFHQICIDNWYSSHNKCPICQQII